MLDVHLHDPSFNFAPSVGGSDDQSSAQRTAESKQRGSEQSGGGRSRMAAVVGLVALVGIALAVRRLRGGDEIEREHPEPTHRATTGA